MTEELKRTLDYLKRSDKNKFGFEQGKLIDYEEAQLLLDYITNLQQENERLNNKIKEQSLLLIEFQDMEQKVDIYKSRCEKITEYCDNNIEFTPRLIDIKNILNGSDENE